jgi:hypothetical protein
MTRCGANNFFREVGDPNKKKGSLKVAWKCFVRFTPSHQFIWE